MTENQMIELMDYIIKVHNGENDLEDWGLLESASRGFTTQTYYDGSPAARLISAAMQLEI